MSSSATASKPSTTHAETPQCMKALERANMVRLARAEVKRAIARGDAEAAEIVRSCPWECETMAIAELLCSQRRWGRTRTRKFLLPLALNENKQLGTLTDRQRRIVASELAARAERRAEEQGS